MRRAATLLAAHAALRRDLGVLRDAVDVLTDELGDAEAHTAAREAVAGLEVLRHAWELQAFCDRFHRVVQIHHGIEDAELFPTVEARTPALGPTLAELVADHLRLAAVLGEVDVAIAALPGLPAERDRARRALATLAEHLEGHLAREEHAILPTLGLLDDEDVTGPAG